MLIYEVQTSWSTLFQGKRELVLISQFHWQKQGKPDFITLLPMNNRAISYLLLCDFQNKCPFKSMRTIIEKKCAKHLNKWTMLCFGSTEVKRKVKPITHIEKPIPTINHDC